MGLENIGKTPKEISDQIERDFQKNSKPNKEAEAKRKAAREAMIATGKAKIAELKDADNQAREKLDAQIDNHKTQTQANIDQLKSQFGQELADAPKGTKSSLRKNQSSQLKAYRDQRRDELKALKAQGKAAIAEIKKKASQDIKKWNSEMYQAKDGLDPIGNFPGTQTGISGFYTDANGIHRPITPKKK
jgi:hypothetical protein